MCFITTYTKKYFDPLNIDESLLDIKDIAHALSFNMSRKWTCSVFFIP
mgnify:CR=1 FL=1